MSKNAPPKMPDIEWFREKINAARREHPTRLVSVEFAQFILDHHSPASGNRKIKPATVRKYADLMEAGKWRDLPCVIIFDTRGYLMDGQNRLSAIIKSQIPLSLVFAFHYPRDSWVGIDAGQPRYGRDMAYMAGYEHPTAAAFVNLHHYAMRGKPLASQQTNDCLAKMQRSPLEIALAMSDRVKGLMQPSAAALFYYRALTVSSRTELLPKFWDMFVNGDKSGPKCPIFRLRERLIRSMKGRQGQATNLEACEALIAAWNAWMRGHTHVVVPGRDDDGLAVPL